MVTFRDLDGCRQDARRGAKNGGDAVVIGGGLLGLEAAHGLACAGHERHRHPPDADADGAPARRRRPAGCSRRRSKRRGQTILTGADTEAILEHGRHGRGRAAEGRARDPGRPRGDGGRHPPQRRRWPRRPGCDVERGIMVDDHMVTCDPAILRGRRMRRSIAGNAYGLVAPLWDMCRSAGRSPGRAGRPAMAARSPRPSSRSPGIDVFSAGDFSGGGGGSEDIVHARCRPRHLQAPDRRRTTASSARCSTAIPPTATGISTC